MKFEVLRRVINQALAPIRRKVNLMVSRAVISGLKEQDSLQLLQLQLFADEVSEDAEHFQEFGFRSKPPAGSEAVALSVGGNREHLAVIATLNRAVRAGLPALADGETIVFNSSGNYYLLKGADIETESVGKWVLNAAGNFEATAPKFKFENDSNELITVLIEWIDQHIINRNITAIGPQPLFAPDIAALQAIKAKLETFKV